MKIVLFGLPRRRAVELRVDTVLSNAIGGNSSFSLTTACPSMPSRIFLLNVRRTFTTKSPTVTVTITSPKMRTMKLIRRGKDHDCQQGEEEGTTQNKQVVTRLL